MYIDIYIYIFLNISKSCLDQCFCAGNPKKTSHLVALQNLGDLKIFGADLTEEDKFDAPIADCDLVFHVATPVNFASQDPEVRSFIRTHAHARWL